MFQCCAPWRRQKTAGLLTFSEGIGKSNLRYVSQIKGKCSLHSKYCFYFPKDQEEVWENDFTKVNVADKLTLADKTNIKKTTNRQLDHVLHYVTRDSEMLSRDTVLYPYTDIKPTETLRTVSL